MCNFMVFCVFEIINNKMFPFEACSPIGIFGPTKSGKTSFCLKLVKHKDKMFTEPPVGFLICYSIWQNLYSEMRKFGYVDFFEGMPSEEILREFAKDNNHRAVILDDMMQNLAKNPTAEKLFCIYAHHMRLSVIYLGQHFFYSHMRTLSLQLHYIVLFKLTRDMSQAMCIFKQIAPRRTNLLMAAYEDSVKTPYSYLVIDCCPSSRHPFVWRNGIFPGEVTYAYLPDENYQQKDRCDVVVK